MVSIAYSQTTILNNKDTLICFNKNQAKFLLQQSIKVNELSELLNNSKAQMSLKDSIIKNKSIIELDYQKLIVNKEQEIGLARLEIKSLNDCLDNQHKAYRRQNFYKWCAIIAGGSLALLEGYYLTK